MFALAPVTLLALAAPALATIYTTNPVAATKANGGEVLEVTWQDDGSAPALETIGVCTVELCIGSPTKQTCIQNLADSVDVSKAESVSTTIDASVGENFDGYFIKYTASNYSVAGMPYMQFSARFELASMTGNFTAEQRALTNDKSNTTSSAVVSASASASSASASSSALASASKSASASASSSSSKASVSASASAKPSGATSGAMAVVAPAGLAIAAAIAGYVAL